MRKMYPLTLLFFLLLLGGVWGCGNSNHHTATCDLHYRKQFVYAFLKDGYYWADEVPRGIDVSRFDDESDLLEHLKNPKDRFSFIIKKNVYDDLFVSDTAQDFGYMNYPLEDSNRSVVLFVYPNSPADRAGIKRSDLLMPIAYLDHNKSVLFDVLSNDGSQREVTLRSGSYVKKEVANAKIFDQNGTKIGYFVLNSFIGQHINDSLDQLFGEFKRNGVSELIVDLRYNGGGNLDIAKHLATLIGGEHVYGHVFEYFRFNQKYSNQNETSYFEKPSQTPNALNLDRVIFITTNNTASASESVISTLRAQENHIDVVIVGDRTYGKPYSMYPVPYCDYVFFPIMMKNFNSDFAEDYDEGFTPTCKAPDDARYDFADSRERSLNESLYYLSHGHCSSK